MDLEVDKKVDSQRTHKQYQGSITEHQMWIILHLTLLNILNFNTLKLRKLLVENKEMKEKRRVISFSVLIIEGMIKLFTSWAVFHLYKFLCSAYHGKSALPMENELFCVLIKLRLNLIFTF